MPETPEMHTELTLERRVALILEATRVASDWLTEGWTDHPADTNGRAARAFSRMEEIMEEFLRYPLADPGGHQARAIFHLMAAVTFNVSGETPNVSFEDADLEFAESRVGA